MQDSQTPTLREAAGTKADGGPPTAIRDRLLDAAQACFLRHGMGKTTVEDVAREANVSRMTVYRNFKNRDELFKNVILRHAQGFSKEMVAKLAEHETVDEKILEGMIFALRELPQGPLHSLFFSSDTAVTTARLAITSESFFELSAFLFEPLIEPARAQGRLREGVTVEQLQEWLVRVMLSFLTVQSSPKFDEGAMRHMIRSFVLPSVLKDYSGEAGTDDGMDSP